MYLHFSKSLKRRKWAITMRPVSIESALLLFLLIWNFPVSRYAQARFFCCFKSTMTIDQNNETKLWLRRLTQLAVGTWFIYMSHLARVFSCSFTFIFNLKMYKEAITEEFICSWHNLLLTPKTWIFNIVSHQNWKLLEGETCWNFCKFTWLYQW